MRAYENERAAVAAERERCELIVYRMKNDTPRAFDYLIDKAARAIRKGTT